MFHFLSPLNQYVGNLLKTAEYEYGVETDSWCAYIEEFPGVYAQQDTIEETRRELEGMIEEYILLNLSKGLPLPHFKKLSGFEIGRKEKKYNEKIKAIKQEKAYAKA